MFDELIENNKENIINTLSKLIKFDSVSTEYSNNGNPFGKTCTDVLSYTLELASSMGFKTKNIDNYCGYIEFGEGEELVGIIGHLDVVPAHVEDGWTTPPFNPTIRDGKLFGRGSIDDKGPVVASLYAMKTIMDTTKISKRVRLILGLNEEKSWKCIEYYKLHEEWPTIGFSPDANFPGIYAEKGIMSIELRNKFKVKNFEIIDINCQDNAINVVPKYCSIILKGPDISLNSDNNITVTYENNLIKIESFGIAAHAAHPELGNNAITNLIKYLLNNFEFDSDYLKYLFDNGIFDLTTPKLLGQKIEDETGILTSNIAVLDYKNENLVIKINLRVPCTYKLDMIFDKYKLIKQKYSSFETLLIGKQEPLYVEKDNYLVKTLVEIFNKKTGQNAEPIAIGGGTYARAFKNFISYGATMPGDKDMCHQVDEFVEIDKLILTTKIYAEAIYKLAK